MWPCVAVYYKQQCVNSAAEIRFPSVQMDRVTAEAKAEQRRLQIEKANKVLWDETDGVKAVHSKILLCDVIKENELLIEQKQMVQGLKRAQEQAFVEQQRQALEVGHPPSD